MIFPVKWLSVCKPRDLVLLFSSVYLSLYPKFNGCCGLFVINFIVFILSRFRASSVSVTIYLYERELCMTVYTNHPNF
jgi:hypothetical protein